MPLCGVHQGGETALRPPTQLANLPRRSRGGAGGAGFQFGVDPTLDPELSMALRLSMEEESARLARAGVGVLGFLQSLLYNLPRGARGMQGEPLHVVLKFPYMYVMIY